jgi:hypothetical protein
MRSESTKALGQPRLTNPTLGGLRIAAFKLAVYRELGLISTPK